MENQRIFIGNLMLGSSPSELRAFLEEKIGPVHELIWPRDNNGLRTYAFAEFEDPIHGERAIAELHGQVFNSRVITVASARPRRTG